MIYNNPSGIHVIRFVMVLVLIMYKCCALAVVNLDVFYNDLALSPGKDDFGFPMMKHGKGFNQGSALDFAISYKIDDASKFMSHPTLSPRHYTSDKSSLSLQPEFISVGIKVPIK